ncbi:MAG: formyltransferase family protein [Chloroflexota bacterium]
MSESLRIVTFNYLPIAFDLLVNWITENGHKHVLAVTTPGPQSRPTPSYAEVVQKAPRDVDVLVTTRIRKVATPLIRELKPDLITCFSFPYRITPELCEIPTHGAVNLHPAVLPAYRGPNVMRQFFDGAPVFGSTVHWIAPEYDTGHILSQRSRPMPSGEFHLQETLMQWLGMMTETINEGFAKALAGDPGVAQDDDLATYAAPFSDEDLEINWQESCEDISRKVAVLSMDLNESATVMIDGKQFKVAKVEQVDHQMTGQTGYLIEKNENDYLFEAKDGVLKVSIAREK